MIVRIKKKPFINFEFMAYLRKTIELQIYDKTIYKFNWDQVMKENMDIICRHQTWEPTLSL